MDSQDQRKTHTPGHESHGVHVCHKCGWPFPNPHPSAKHRRAHKKICGTIEGYKLCAAEDQARSNGSDDEHVSDDDHKTPGPKALDMGNNEKRNNGMGKKINRPEDEVFSDAAAEFSDSGLNQGVKERLQEGSLESGTSVARVDKEDPKFSGSSEDNDSNDAVVSQLTVESRDDRQIRHTEIFQGERVEVGNTLELQGQLSGSTVDPLSNSIADLGPEESTVVHSGDIFGFSTEPHPSKAEAMPDVLPENKIYAGENVTDCSMTSAALETILRGNDEIKSDRDEVEIVVPSDSVVGETSEGESKVAVTDAVDFGLSTQSQPSKAEEMPDVLPENKIYAGENLPYCSLSSAALETSLKGKDVIKSDRDEVEIVVPSDAGVGETCEGESEIAVSDAVYSDDQVVEGAVNLKEKDSAKFLSVLGQDDPPLGSNSVVITNGTTNDVHVESAHVVQFVNPSDVETFQEKEEGNVNANTLPKSDDTTDVPHSQSEYEDFKDHEGVVSQDLSGLHSSESAHVVQFVNCSDVETLQEKEEGNVNANTLPTGDDRTDVPHSQSEYEDSIDHEGVVSQDLSGLHSPESLKHEENDLKDAVTEENNFIFNPSQLTEKNDVLSPNIHVMDNSGSMNKELVNSEPMAEEMHEEERTEVSPVKLTVESSQISDEIGVSLNAKEFEMNESHMVHFSEEQGPVDVETSQHISLPESILMASLNENLGDASFCTVTNEATSVISIDNTSHHEKNGTEINDVAVNGKDVGANLENDLGTQTNDLQHSDLLLEVKQSSDSSKSDDAGEMDKIEKIDITDAHCGEPVSNQFDSPGISDAVIDEPTGKSTGIECTNIGPLSGSMEDIKEDEINGNVKVYEERNRSIGTSADSYQAQDAEISVKAAEDLTGKCTSPSLNAEPSGHDFAVKDDRDGQPGGEVSGITAVPVQDQSGNNLAKHNSSGIDASVCSSSRCDSLEANWGSVSVLSMQSDAPALIDAETSPSTGMAASTEAGKSNLNPKTASEREHSRKSEMFEAPSFMTLVKAPASEGQKEKNAQQPSSTSQARWFPYQTQVTNESQGRNKNEEIIAKVTNWSTSKEHTPLKSLLGEAAHSNNPNSPRVEENSVNRKNGKLPQNNGSGLTTVNSILGPGSPGAQAVIGDAAKEWNSPARYPAEMKREKRRVKSRPYWIQLVCCSSVDLRRR